MIEYPAYRIPTLGNAVVHKAASCYYDGLPIYVDLLEALAKFCKHRVKAKYQNIINIVGDTGSGKSTLGYQLCLAIDPFFRLEHNYIYDVQDLADKMALPPSEVSPVNFMDEGSVILNSNRHNVKEQVRTVTIFDTMRTRGMTTIICSPKFRDVNNRVREEHTNFLLSCAERAPLKGYGKRGFFKLYRPSTHGTFSNNNYWYPIAWGVFGPLTPKQDREYQAFKSRSQNRILREYVEECGSKPEDVEE